METGNNNITNDSSTTRRGGARNGKSHNIKVVVKPVYAGERSLNDVIGSAIVNGFMREIENHEGAVRNTA